MHDDAPDDHDENDDPETLSGAGLIVVQRAITDNDGDTASDSADLTGLFSFEDDGPAIGRNAAALPALVTDDTDIEDSDSASFAALFDTAFGTDGFKDADDDDAPRHLLARLRARVRKTEQHEDAQQRREALHQAWPARS